MAQKLDTDTWYVRHCNGSQCCRHLDADAVPCGIRLPGWEPGEDSAEAETRSFLAGSKLSKTFLNRITQDIGCRPLLNY